ncbi:MAG: hypothetical protein RLY40_110 [Pseudomonadota bacterium]
MIHLNNLKLIKKIRKLLTSANQEFYKQIKKNKEISDNYKSIGKLYLAIIKHLENVEPLPEFEFYRLAARFGLLKCEVNSFQLCPLNDITIKQNESQLISYCLRIQQFLKLISLFERQLNFSNNPEFYKEFNQLKKQIDVYAKNWEKYENDLTAAFTYNYADFLLSKGSGSIKETEKAIVYFQHASDCYANNKRQKEKEETNNKISEVNALLVQLQSSQATQLKVSIPLFLIPQVKTGITPILIENKPLLANSSKTETLPKTNPSLSSTHIKLNAKRKHVGDEAKKNTFFQSKKINKAIDQSYHYPDKNLSHSNST